jgi:subtilisin-like proprotein convertase family protein
MRRRPALWLLPIVASAQIWSTTTAYACDLRDGWKIMTTETKPTTIKASLFMADSRAPVSRPFDIKVRICAEHPPNIDRIAVDAIMPKHRHGMNYIPEVERLPDGSFVAKRLVFHMPGDWRISISTHSGGAVTRHFLDVVAKGR